MGLIDFDWYEGGYEAASLDWSDPVKRTKTTKANDNEYNIDSVYEYETELPMAVGV